MRIQALTLACAALCWTGCGSSSSTKTGSSSGSSGAGIGAGSTGGGSSAGSFSGSGATGGSTAAASTGGSGSSSGGTSAGGGIDVTLAVVGIHPAAVAALAALPVPISPPNLDGGYSVVLEGVQFTGVSAQINVLGVTPLTDGNDQGPITFSNVDVSGSVANLGLLTAIVSDSLFDGGLPPAPTWPSCATLQGSPDGGAYVDSFVVSSTEIHAGAPTASVDGGMAYAMPASYLALLDCAAGQPPGTFLGEGLALLYASAAPDGLGAPLPGITFAGGGSLLYYPDGYGAGSATTSAPTGDAGVATVTGVHGLGTLQASGGPGNFSGRSVAMGPHALFQVFFAPGS